MGANRHTTGGFDRPQCNAFDAQAAAKLRECADALTALKADTPTQEAVALWQWDTSFTDTTAMHTAAVLASVAAYLDRVATFHKTLIATRSRSVETIGRLSLPAPLKPTLRRRPASSCLTTETAGEDQSEDRRAIEDARLSQRHARRAVEQSKRIDLVVLDPSERIALQHELRQELEEVEAELIAAVRTVDKLAARHSRQKANGADADLAEAAARLSTSLRRDLSQLKSALDHSPSRRRNAVKRADGAGAAGASKDVDGGEGDDQHADAVQSLGGSNEQDEHPAAGNAGSEQSEESTKSNGDRGGSAADSVAKSKGSPSKAKRTKKNKHGGTKGASAMHRDRNARINASLQGAVDNPSYSQSLTSKQLDTEQATLMAQKAREDDLSTALLSARQKLEAIAEQRTKLAQHVVSQNETLVRVRKDVDDAKDDITSGNEEVKKATSSQNDMRWGVVFFLLMCSICLLFLEWEGRR